LNSGILTGLLLSCEEASNLSFPDGRMGKVNATSVDIPFATLDHDGVVSHACHDIADSRHVILRECDLNSHFFWSSNVWFLLILFRTQNRSLLVSDYKPSDLFIKNFFAILATLSAYLLLFSLHTFQLE
jgi:hypothetical protein